MQILKAIYRFIMCWILVFLMIIIYFISFIWTKNPIQRIKTMVPICSFICRFGLKVLGLRVNIVGLNHLDLLNKNSSYLLISNHMTYLDVLIVTSQIPSSFVTSVETKNNFLLGPICKAGGSLFVERRKKFTLKKEIEMIKEVLSENIKVCVFPEATSSNGEQLLPFKNALLESAIRAQKPILPLCLQYKKINHQKITKENRDLVYYYGEMSFLPHLIKFLCIDSLEVTLNILEPVFPPYHENSRNEIGELLYEKISKRYAS